MAKINISGTLWNDTKEAILAYASQIKDSNFDKFQSEINEIFTKGLAIQNTSSELLNANNCIVPGIYSFCGYNTPAGNGVVLVTTISEGTKNQFLQIWFAISKDAKDLIYLRIGETTVSKNADVSSANTSFSSWSCVGSGTDLTNAIARIAALETAGTALAGRVSSAESNIFSLNSKVSTNTSEISSVKVRTTSLENKEADTQSRVTSLESKVSKNTESISEINIELGTVGTQISALKDSDKVLSDSVQSLDSYFSNGIAKIAALARRLETAVVLSTVSGENESNKVSFDGSSDVKIPLPDILTLLGLTVTNSVHLGSDSSYFDYKDGVATFKGVAELQEGSKLSANIIADNVVLGFSNLLLNTSFVGIYDYLNLTEGTLLTSDLLLSSNIFDYWNYANATVIAKDSSLHSTAVVLDNGTISQTLITPNKLVVGKDYCVHFKGYGSSVTVKVGGVSQKISISSVDDEYSYVFKCVSASGTDQIFVLSGSCTIYELVLSEGNVASTWRASLLDKGSFYKELETFNYLKEIFPLGTDPGTIKDLYSHIYGILKDEVFTALGGLNLKPSSVNDVFDYSSIDGTYAAAVEAFTKLTSDYKSVDSVGSLINFVRTYSGLFFCKELFVDGKFIASASTKFMEESVAVKNQLCNSYGRIKLKGVLPDAVDDATNLSGWSYTIPYDGYCVFVKSANKPVWFKGTSWYDATGNKYASIGE